MKKKTKQTTGRKERKRNEKTKERMMAEPLVVLETPLVDHHLVPTAPGAGPRKDRYPVFKHHQCGRCKLASYCSESCQKRHRKEEGTNIIASRLLIAKHPPLRTQYE